MVDDFGDNIGPNYVGRRLRDIRNWRGQTLEVTAGLAGISFGHLGRLERGEKALTNRATLEALAHALQVSPLEFSPAPWQTAADDATAGAHAGLVAIETALDTYELGDDPDVSVREWPEIAADVHRLGEMAQVTADYAGQAALAPGLLAELHALYTRDPAHRRDALLGLITCYASATWTAKRLGGRGLPLLAARAAQQCAAMLEDPAWIGFCAWLRGDATGGLSRPEQYRRAMRTADELRPHLDDTDTIQAYGMLHLSAALAAAVQGDRTGADTHLSEADDIAGRLPVETGTFARLWFGRPNIGIWRAAIGLELGDGAAVAERARSVNIAAVPGKSRRAEFFMEVGRSLLTDPHRRDEGVSVLLRAEQLAPQRVHADVFVREAVADHLRAARRDAGGRNLRGLAWRLGIAPELAPPN
ncbi:helix-turn-helix domain-containing protein [Nocardia wallacei]|uniref:helix-turn-helix domain-containing protein n=1 Tax=Nocardia wallacei TaxID=480035 RepID=UPI002453CED7|nr:helix-turn-helix transcriptional regulator [Nocardia wallacei]